MRILHVADTHLGFRQYGLDVRRNDFAAALAQVVDTAISEKVSAVIHAGDLFDNRTPTTDDLSFVIGELRRLQLEQIPFLGIVGNHEGKRDTQWLDLFAQLNLAVHLGADPYDLDGVPVWGVDYISRRPSEVVPLQAPDGILVMHQLLDKTISHGELLMEDLGQCKARLVLLGDYHEHKAWREGGALVSYCGSTERVSSAERMRRGFSIIDWETLALERRELDTRRFVYLGKNTQPVADPVAELEAMARLVKDAVVIVYVSQPSLTPRQLQQEGQARGALHVIVRNVQFETEEEEVGFTIEQLATMEQLDGVVDAALPGRDFSSLLHEIDQVVRDPEVPDRGVDERVTQLLTEAGLCG